MNVTKSAEQILFELKKFHEGRLTPSQHESINGDICGDIFSTFRYAFKNDPRLDPRDMADTLVSMAKTYDNYRSHQGSPALTTSEVIECAQKLQNGDTAWIEGIRKEHGSVKAYLVDLILRGNGATEHEGPNGKRFDQGKQIAFGPFSKVVHEAVEAWAALAFPSRQKRG